MKQRESEKAETHTLTDWVRAGLCGSRGVCGTEYVLCCDGGGGGRGTAGGGPRGAGPQLAMERVPGPRCRRVKFSSANRSP